MMIRRSPELHSRGKRKTPGTKPGVA